MSPDPVAEQAKGQPLRQREIDAFLSEGIPAHALAFDHDGSPNVLARDMVSFVSDRRFEFDREGRTGEACRVWTWLARDLTGEPADVVAWKPGGPFGLWLGAVPLVGMEQSFRMRSDREEALPVHPDFESWFRARRRGVVILDYWGALDVLHTAAPLLVGNPLHGAWLRDCLTVPAPRIVVGNLQVPA